MPIRLCGLILAASALLLQGCAGKPADRVIVDTWGVDPERYERDLAECEAHAYRVNTAGRAGGEAARGAVVGGAIGAILGSSRSAAARGAGTGGVLGGARGARAAEQEQLRVVKNCMRGRGYRVLN